MEYLFTQKNLKVLESFSIVETLYAFDYDGTLAPIVSTPEGASLSEQTSKLLIEVNKLVPVAIITGRSVADLKKRLPFEPRYIIGNHGIEGTHSENELKHMLSLTRGWLAHLNRYKTSHFDPNNIVIEDKGYSISLHYRNSASPADAAVLCTSVVSQLPEVNMTSGKCVINLLPKQGMNKGQALEWILQTQNYNFGFYIGDDETDEDVFQYKNPKLMTVKVGEDPKTNAKYFLKSQSETERLLDLLLQFHLKKFN